MAADTLLVFTRAMDKDIGRVFSLYERIKLTIIIMIRVGAIAYHL